MTAGVECKSLPLVGQPTIRPRAHTPAQIGIQEVVQILILFSCTCILLAQPLPTCAAYYTSLTRGAVRPPLISGDRRITLETPPPQPKRPSMKFLCVVHVCFCVGCERGCECVHLACCIIKALMLPRREKKGSEV